jgi:hypothetical protein
MPDFIQFVSIFSVEVMGIFDYFDDFPDDVGTLNVTCLLGL